METKILKAFSHIFGVELKMAISMTVSKYEQGGKELLLLILKLYMKGV